MMNDFVTERHNDPSVASFAKFLTEHGKQPATVESYCRDAKRFLEFLTQYRIPIGNVEPQTLIDFQRQLVEEGLAKENSVRRSVIGIRQFFRFLTESRNLACSPLDNAPIPERSELLPEMQMRLRVSHLIDQIMSKDCNGLLQSRNAAIMTLLAYEGIKASELIELRWQDLFDAQPATLKITGSRQRIIALNPETTRMLKRYQSVYKTLRHAALAKDTSPRIFISFKGRDATHLIPHVTRHGIKFILYEVGRDNGIKHLNTELLRHHAIGFLLNQGKNPEEVMAHLGLRRIGLIKRYLNQSSLIPFNQESEINILRLKLDSTI